MKPVALSDFAAGTPDIIESMKLYIVYDADVSEAIAVVHNDACNGKIGLFSECPYQMSQVSDVLIGYMDLMINEPKLKYYYDEYNDRTDPYRKTLVTKISSKTGQSESNVQLFMNHLYWAIKDGRLKNNIVLKPRDKGKSSDNARGGILGPLVKSGEYIIDGTGKIIAGAAEGAGSTLTVIGSILKYLPVIAGVGVTIYGVYTLDKIGVIKKLLPRKKGKK